MVGFRGIFAVDCVNNMHSYRSKMKRIDTKSRILQNYTYWSLTDGLKWFMLGLHIWLEKCCTTNFLLQCLKTTHEALGWSSRPEIENSKNFVWIKRRKRTTLLKGDENKQSKQWKAIQEPDHKCWVGLNFCWSAKVNAPWCPVALSLESGSWLNNFPCQSQLP